ncbi:6-carboxytetrahydropterin synthase [Halostella sp. JP-L12]|uniref:6-pyruvoyl trahydropterin synthase family protein n=1 Tax=Halostella TaxID=1843185 RepID=UPI000EF827C7|nr:MULTISPECIES: 6-carboxytetrahydropterin synthase [Halostella]NHN48472.1 6-carboxytetrahydropterin synthase [Halostella sp. JP-L12]
MYTVTVSETFVAQHYLTVPDPGPEGDLHSHTFTAAVEFAGSELGEYGYLLDIDDAVEAVEAAAERYRDATLNDLPEIEGNPSAERLAAAFGDRVADRVDAPAAETMTVTVREDDVAEVSNRRAL